MGWDMSTVRSRVCVLEPVCDRHGRPGRNQRACCIASARAQLLWGSVTGGLSGARRWRLRM